MPKKISDVSRKILDAAAEIYLKEGKISIREISAISGLAVGTVYTRYEDKEEIVALVLAKEIEHIKDLIIESVFNKYPKEALKSAIHTFLTKVNSVSIEGFEKILHMEGHKEYIQKTLGGASNQIKEVLKQIIMKVYDELDTHINEDGAALLAEVSFSTIHLLSKMKDYSIEHKVTFIYEFIISYGESGATGLMQND